MKIFAIEPVPKPRMTQSDRWNNRPSVMRYFAFKDALRLEANRRNFTITNGLRIRFVLPMPMSWSITKRSKFYDGPHQQKPDLDNLLKAFFDALLEDDSIIWSVAGVDKVWGTEGMIMIG